MESKKTRPASKTSTLYFGYRLASEDRQRTYRILLHRLLQLSLDRKVQLLYVDNEVEERRVTVFRFTSPEAYDTYHDELLDTAEGLECGVWEPSRDARQHGTWKAELSDATPTLFL